MSFRRFTIAAFALILLARSAAADAAERGVSVQVQVDKAQMRIGDLLTYRVTVISAAGIETAWALPTEQFGSFQVRDRRLLKPQVKKGRKTESALLTLQTFALDETVLPPLEVRYRKAGGEWRMIASAPLVLSVLSMNPDLSAEIRDIHGPMTPPFNTMRLVGILLAAALATAAVLYIIHRRRHRLPILPQKQAPPRPAHEIALEELDRLCASDLLSRGRIKDYYTQLSDIIRRYVDGRFDICAPEMTTTQLLDELKNRNRQIPDELPSEAIAVMRDFLEPCDLVKFAAYRPEDEEHRRTTALAYRFVDVTKPIVQEEQPETVAEVGRD